MKCIKCWLERDGRGDIPYALTITGFFLVLFLIAFVAVAIYILGLSPEEQQHAFNTLDSAKILYFKIKNYESP